MNLEANIKANAKRGYDLLLDYLNVRYIDIELDNFDESNPSYSILAHLFPEDICGESVEELMKFRDPTLRFDRIKFAAAVRFKIDHGFILWMGSSKDEYEILTNAWKKLIIEGKERYERRTL